MIRRGACVNQTCAGTPHAIMNIQVVRCGHAFTWDWVATIGDETEVPLVIDEGRLGPFDGPEELEHTLQRLAALFADEWAPVVLART